MDIGAAVAHTNALLTFLADFAASSDDAASKLKTLTEDFLFNLKVIEDRDRELDQCLARIDALKRTLSERDASISDLQASLATKQSDLDSSRSFYAAQEHHHADALRKLRRDHETALQEMISVTVKKEKELADLQESCEMKMVSMTEELSELRLMTFSVLLLTSKIRDVDKRLRDLKWEYADHQKQTSSAITTLKHELSKTTSQLEALQSSYEAEKQLKEAEFLSKETSYRTNIEQAHTEIENLSKQVIQLEMTVKNQTAEIKKIRIESQELIEDRDEIIEKLRKCAEKDAEAIGKLKQSHELKVCGILQPNRKDS
ncbi:hypothetical protein HDU82_006827 [Entophlyctis luteolus]|nr:hypothetical protein HDU82_006827 [Entophlyctis luteolus]